MSGTPEQYYVSKAQNPIRRLDYLRKRFQNWFLDLSVEGQSYSIGLSFVIVAGVFALFNRPGSGVLAQIGASVFSLGLLPLIESLYEWAWRQLFGKLMIAALIALATNMAYGFGRQMVGSLIGTSPEPFSATVNIATILASPLLFLAALAIGGIFIFIIALYIGSLALIAVLPSPTPGKGTRITLWICRFVALAIAVFGSMVVLQRTTGYIGWVERRTADYLYAFDMYHDTHYAPDKTQKIALLPDGRFLLGSPSKEAEGYDFRILQYGIVPPAAEPPRNGQDKEHRK